MKFFEFEKYFVADITPFGQNEIHQNEINGFKIFNKFLSVKNLFNFVQPLQQNLGAHLVFGTLLNKLWQILYAIGQIWIVVFVSLVVSTLVNEFVRLSLASARKQKA